MRSWLYIILLMPVLLAAVYQSRTSLFRAWTSPSLTLMSRLSWHSTALKMSTFQHPDYNIPITLPAGLSQSQLLSFDPFKSWLTTLQTALHTQHTSLTHPFHTDPYSLHSVTVQAYDRFGSGRVGFLKLSARVANGAGETLPGAVFLRGPSVAMLVMLLPEDDGSSPQTQTQTQTGGGIGRGEQQQGSGEEKKEEEEEEEEEERYVLLTVQPRVAAGSLAFVELPAGMVDEAGNFAGQAAREIKEELGLEIREDELVNLSELVGGLGDDGAAGEEGDVQSLPRAMYPSAGGCDEYIPIYMHERRVPRAQLGEWTGKLTGLREDGEKITLKLVRMRDLWREGARDAKCLAAVALWEGLRREGKV